MSDLYLIRHGQASFGTSDYDALSELGHEQTALVARHWLALGRRIDACYSGPLLRQRQTAERVATLHGAPGAALPVTVLEGLAEYDADALIARYRAQRGVEVPPSAPDRPAYQRLLEATGRAWIAGELDGAGESFALFRARVGDALESIRAREGRGRSILAAASAGVVGAAVGHVLGLADAQALALSWMVHNSSVTLFRYDPARMMLAGFNCVSHLERGSRLDLLTYR